MYELTANDLDETWDGDTPNIHAAAKSDSAILEALLADHAASSAEPDLPEWKNRRFQRLGPDATTSGSTYSFFLSPIISATKARLPKNV
jgi:hypothetical protein